MLRSSAYFGPNIIIYGRFLFVFGSLNGGCTPATPPAGSATDHEILFQTHLIVWCVEIVSS